MNCNFGPYNITTSLESIGESMFKSPQEARRLVVFSNCEPIALPCSDAVVLHRKNNCPECDILWYECPSVMGRIYTLIATPCGVTITSFEDGLLVSGSCNATEFGSQHFCFGKIHSSVEILDSPDKSMVTFTFEGHDFTVQGNIGTCPPDLFECEECQAGGEIEAFATLPAPPPAASAPAFDSNEETITVDDILPTQVIPGESRPDWRGTWNNSADPDPSSFGTDTLCEAEKPLTDRPAGGIVGVCESNDNPSVAALPSGHTIVAYEDRGENGITKISLAILSSSVHMDVRYHRTLSKGTLLNNLAETGGIGHFEVYDEIRIAVDNEGIPVPGTNLQIGFLTGPMAGLIRTVTKFRRSVDKSRVTITFEFIESGQAFEFPDKNNVHNVQWFLLDAQGSEDLPPPNQDNVITTITLPSHLDSAGDAVPVANPSIAVARNNLMVQSEQVIYVSYQAYESNQWRVYLREIVLGGDSEAPPTYVAPYLFFDDSQRQIEIMSTQSNLEIQTFGIGNNLWDEDFSTFTHHLRIGDSSDWAEVQDINEFPNAGTWPTWRMFDRFLFIERPVLETNIYFCDPTTSLPTEFEPCFENPPGGRDTCIATWNSRLTSTKCQIGPTGSTQISQLTRTMAQRTSITGTSRGDSIVTTLRFAVMNTVVPSGLGAAVDNDTTKPEIWFWWGKNNPFNPSLVGRWRLQILRGVRAIDAAAGVPQSRIDEPPGAQQSIFCSNGGCVDNHPNNECFVFRLYDQFRRSGFFQSLEDTTPAFFSRFDHVLREAWHCLGPTGSTTDDYVYDTGWNEWRVETYLRGRMRYFDIYLDNAVTNNVLMATFREWDTILYETDTTSSTSYNMGQYHGFGFAHGNNRSQIIIDRIKTDELTSPTLEASRQQITLDGVGVPEGHVFYEDDISMDGWLGTLFLQNRWWSGENVVNQLKPRASHHLYNLDLDPSRVPVPYHPTAWSYTRMSYCFQEDGDSFYPTLVNVGEIANGTLRKPIPTSTIAKMSRPGDLCSIGSEGFNGLWSHTVINAPTFDIFGSEITNNVSMVLSAARDPQFATAGAYPYIWFVMRLQAKTDFWGRGYRIRITRFTSRHILAASAMPNGGSRPAISPGESYWKISLYPPTFGGGMYDDTVSDEVYIKIVSGPPGAGETNIEWIDRTAEPFGSAASHWPYFRVDQTIENGVPPFIRFKIYVGNDIGGDPGIDPVKFDEISYSLLHTFNTSSVSGGAAERPFYGFVLMSGSKTDPEIDDKDYFVRIDFNYVKLEKLPETAPPLGVCCRSVGGCTNNVLSVDCPLPDIWVESDTCFDGSTGFDCSAEFPIGAGCTGDGVCHDGITQAAAANNNIGTCPNCEWQAGKDCFQNSGGTTNPLWRNCPPAIGLGSCCRLFQRACVNELTLQQCEEFWGITNLNMSPVFRLGENCNDEGPFSLDCDLGFYHGACCFENGDCQIVPNSSACNSANHGAYFPSQDCVSAPCSQLGACCRTNNNCEQRTEENCLFVGGSFNGVGSTCFPDPCTPDPDPIKACCSPQGTCQNTIESICSAPSVWIPTARCLNFPCPPATGACCNPITGVCTDSVPVNDCQNAGNTGSAGFLCSQVTCNSTTGGCCVNSSCVLNQTQADCTAAGGQYLGDGMQCIPGSCTEPPPVGGCCVGSNCIPGLTQFQCTDTGGNYLGDSSACTAGDCDSPPPPPPPPPPPEDRTPIDPYVDSSINYKPEDLWVIEISPNKYVTRVLYHMQEEVLVSSSKISNDGSVNAIDFMFLIDHSASMELNFNSAAFAIPQLSEQIIEKGFDVRFGFTFFGRGAGIPFPNNTHLCICSGSSAAGHMSNALQLTIRCRDGNSDHLEGEPTNAVDGFTRNIEYLQRALNCWGVASGSVAPWSAIQYALVGPQFVWRENAAKIIFFATDSVSDEGCTECGNGQWLNLQADATDTLLNEGAILVPVVDSSVFIEDYLEVAVASGWDAGALDVNANNYAELFEQVISFIDTKFRLENATIIERATTGAASAYLKKGETIISYDGDLSDLWSFNKSDFAFKDNHVPFPGTVTKGLSNLPFQLAAGKIYGIDSIHIQGIPENWVSFGKEGPLNYEYPDGVGLRASSMVDSPILIAANSTRPKVFVNNRNQVIVAYESYSSGTPQIEIKGTGDFHQDSITGPKASRIQRFVTPNDFAYSHAITLPSEGMNQICDFIVDNSDITHIVWQSNRDDYWEIYYANSSDLFNPVRITKADSKSGHPSISVDDSGSIFVVYHDNRFGPFNIMLASKDEERVIPLLEQDAYLASLRNKYTHYTNTLPVFIDHPSSSFMVPIAGQFWANKDQDGAGNDSETHVYQLNETTGASSNRLDLQTFTGSIHPRPVAIAFSSTSLWGIEASSRLLRLGSIGDDNKVTLTTASEVGINPTSPSRINPWSSSSTILDMAVDKFDRIWVLVHDSGPIGTLRLILMSSSGGSQLGSDTIIVQESLSPLGASLAITPDNKFFITWENVSSFTLSSAPYPVIGESSTTVTNPPFPVIEVSSVNFEFTAIGILHKMLDIPPGEDEGLFTPVAMTADASGNLFAVSSDNDLYTINKSTAKTAFQTSLTSSSGSESSLPVGTTSGIAFQNLNEAVTGGAEFFHIRIDFYDNISFEGVPFLSVDSRDNLEAFINDELLVDPYFDPYGTIQGLTARGILVSPGSIGIVFFDATNFVPGFSRLSQPFSFEPNQTYFPRVFAIDETDNLRLSGVEQLNSFSCSKCSRFGNNNFNSSSCSYSFVVQNNSQSILYYNFQIDFYADIKKQHLIRRFEATPGSDDLQYIEVDNVPAVDLWTTSGLPVEGGNFPFIQVHPVLDPQSGFLCGVKYTVQVNKCSTAAEEECSDFSILIANNWIHSSVGETFQTVATDLVIPVPPPASAANALTSGFSMAVIRNNLGIAWRSDDNNIMYSEFNGTAWTTQTVASTGFAIYSSLASVSNQPAIHLTVSQGTFWVSAVLAFDGIRWSDPVMLETVSSSLPLPNPRSLVELDGFPMITFIGTGEVSNPTFSTSSTTAIWDENPACGTSGSCFTDNATINGLPAVVYIALHQVTYAEWDTVNATFSNIQVVDSGSGTNVFYHGHLGIAEIDGQPAVAYIKVQGSKGRLVYARFNGTTWQKTFVTGVFDFNSHVSMASINNVPAIVYSVKISATTSQLRYATFSGSSFSNEIVDHLNVSNPMVSVVEFQNAAAVSASSNPFRVYFFRQQSTAFVRDISPAFFCECSSKIFTNRLTHLNQVNRWESSAHGFSDTRVTDSTGDSLRPVIQTRTTNAAIILWEDNVVTENCGSPPCIRAATFRNVNQDQLRGSGTGSWFDYDFGISGQDSALALDLYDRVNVVYEKARAVDPLTKFHGSGVSKDELPSNELYRKVCDFAIESSSQGQVPGGSSECDISSLESNVITLDKFISSKIVRKIRVKDRFVAYYTYNASGILTPIVSDCNLALEIYGTPEIVALRLKNEDSIVFGPWCAWSPQISDFAMEKDYKISNGSGIKEVCVQAMTYSGITSEFCIPIVADYETIVFESKFYKNTDIDGIEITNFNVVANDSFPADLDAKLVPLPLSDGISVASLGSFSGGSSCAQDSECPDGQECINGRCSCIDSSGCSENEICIGGRCLPKISTILVEIIPNKELNETTISFDVIQQGTNDHQGQLSKGKNNLGRGMYRGSFIIEREDKFFNADGLARVIPAFPSACEDTGNETVEAAIMHTRDMFNKIGGMPTEETKRTEVTDSLADFRQTVSGRVGVTLDIRPPPLDLSVGPNLPLIPFIPDLPDLDPDLDPVSSDPYADPYDPYGVPFAPGPVSNHGVWIEINLATPAERQRFVDGTPSWEPIVDYIVVSTAPGNSGLYATLRAEFLEAHGRPLAIPLIPGMKPWTLFAPCPPSTIPDANHLVCDLNNPSAWQDYADELTSLIDATGTDTVLLENETLVAGYVNGETVLDLDVIRAGIDLFPKDVEYWWYPAIASSDSAGRERQRILYQIAAEVLPNVRFVASGHRRHEYVFADFKEAGQIMTEALVDRRTNDVIYVFPDVVWWRNDRTRQVLKYLYSDGDVMMYPGLSGFVEQGQALNAILIHRH